MRRITGIFILLLLVACIGASAQPARHVVLITIDGFRPEFYLDAEWGAVNLQQLKASGACVKRVRGIFPTVTFPSHTTLVTGSYPASHGIFYNVPFIRDGSTDQWYFHFKDIRSSTLWDAARKKGLKTGSVLWPVTVGAPIDYNVPDIFLIGNSDRLAVTRQYTTPPALWDEIEQNATGKLAPNDFNLDKDYLSMDENVARMSAYIIRKYKPSFVALHLPAVDHAEHHDGRDGDQVRRAVAGADRAIRTIVEALDKAGVAEQSTIIVTGDHGFAERQATFSPNILLSQAGLFSGTKEGEWKARFHASGGSAFLYLHDRKDRATLNAVRKLLIDLPDSTKRAFRVLTEPELRTSGADPEVVLALTANPGYNLGGATTGALLRKGVGGNHGHFPDLPEIHTGLVMFGAGVKKGAVIQEINMVDIAPTIARLLGIDLGRVDGRVRQELLSE